MRKNQFLIRITTIFIALLLTDKLFDGIYINNLVTLLTVSVLMAILNSIVKPFLILITIPVTLGSLGFFLLIINALILWLAAMLIDGFVIHSFASAFWGAISLSLLNMIIGGMLKK